MSSQGRAQRLFQIVGESPVAENVVLTGAGLLGGHLALRRGTARREPAVL